ncbi:c-type cytochrome [Salipiger sp.]|uniref:c-type cytochrome n=1 Tax=Salipiger sp. TaxID=2078585 RepID=UPI003A96CA6A
MHKPILTAALLSLAGPALAQDDTDPQTAYNNHCRTCHSQDEGDNRLGPSLHAILGKKAAATEGYAFSDALAGADITWDEATLDAWIENPDAVVTGHRMKPYPGISDPGIRAAIIEQLSDG